MKYCRIQTGVVFEVLEVDDPPAAPGLVWVPDPTATAAQGDLWDGNAFSRPPVDLEPHRRAAIRRLEAAFTAELDGGFESSALGAPHRYDSEAHNRENLLGAAAAGEDRDYTCDDLQAQPTSKARRLHTAGQLLQVLRDGAAHKDSLIVRLRAKREAVEGAAGAAAIAAVTW